MAKYKCGDKVRIVSERPQRYWNPEMDKWLGKTMTITESGINGNGVYYFVEEDAIYFSRHWFWYEDMIAGLAEPEREPCTVELRFDGMITTATLKRGGRDVKTAEARCNPKDTYSRAEGARIAVERLFEKKRKEDKPKESEPKIGDKFVITSLFCYPAARVGEIVTLYNIIGSVKLYKASDGALLIIHDCNVKPYKENAK
jgi:hypothetical protein